MSKNGLPNVLEQSQWLEAQLKQCKQSLVPSDHQNINARKKCLKIIRFSRSEQSFYISAHRDNPKLFGQKWIMISYEWSSAEIRVDKASQINVGCISISIPLIVSVTFLEYKNSWIHLALYLVSAAESGWLSETV